MIELHSMQVKFYRVLDHGEYEKHLTVDKRHSTEHHDHFPYPHHFHQTGTIDYRSLKASVIGELTDLLRNSGFDPNQENDIISIDGVEVVVDEFIASGTIYHEQTGAEEIKEGLFRRPREHGQYLEFSIPEVVGIVRYSSGGGNSLEGMLPILVVLASQQYDLHIVTKGTSFVGPRLDLEAQP